MNIRTLFIALVVLIVTIMVSQTSRGSESVDTSLRHDARNERLLSDSTYRQFVLDSLERAQQYRLQALQIEHGHNNDRFDPEGTIAVFIPIIAIISVFFMLWRSSEAKKAVRLAMIEKGMDPSLLDDRTPREDSKKYASLRIGLAIGGAGLGLLIATGIVMFFSPAHLGDWTVAIVFACVSIGAGIGLSVYHIIARKLEAKS